MSLLFSAECVHYKKENVSLYYEDGEIYIAQDQGGCGPDTTMDYVKLLNLPEGTNGCC